MSDIASDKAPVSSIDGREQGYSLAAFVPHLSTAPYLSAATYPSTFRFLSAVARIAFALLLVSAALLKMYQLVAEPPHEDRLLAMWVLMASVAFELALAGVILSGRYPRLSFLGAVICLAVFAEVSLYRALLGEPSCGCFGALQVSPWVTFAFDVAGLLALGLWHSSSSWRDATALSSLAASTSPGGRREAKLICLVVICVSAGGAMAPFTPLAAALAADAGPRVVLAPTEWLGKPFPLSQYLDVAGPLRSGRWKVLLFNRHCPSCQAARSRYESLSDATVRVAIIDVSPRDAASEIASADGEHVLRGGLSRARRFQISTPTEIELNDGVVTRVVSAGHEVGAAFE